MPDFGAASKWRGCGRPSLVPTLDQMKRPGRLEKDTPAALTALRTRKFGTVSQHHRYFTDMTVREELGTSLWAGQDSSGPSRGEEESRSAVPWRGEIRGARLDSCPILLPSKARAYTANE
jgi:hypothetical protein